MTVLLICPVGPLERVILSGTTIIAQISMSFNSTENDIQLLGLSESKLKANHPSNHFAIKNFQLFRRDRILSADRPEQGGGIIVYVKDDINCVRISEFRV